MKDKSAFEESVFNKSEIIFAKRKRRRKLIATLTSSSLCVMLLFTLLLHSPIGFDDFMPMEKSEAYAPEVENAGGHFYKADEDKMTDASLNYDKKAEEEAADAPSATEAVVSTAATPAETQAPAEVPEISTSTEKEIPEITDKMPLFVEITTFGSTVTVYTAEKDIENILIALTKYFALSEKSQKKTAEVSVNYSDDASFSLVGQEFFDILDAIKN